MREANWKAEAKSQAVKVSRFSNLLPITDLEGGSTMLDMAMRVIVVFLILAAFAALFYGLVYVGIMLAA